MGTSQGAMDGAERWLADSLDVVDQPGGMIAVDVDMSGAAVLVARLRERGVRVTYNHLIVRAAGLALDRHPDLALVVAGTRRATLERVDITLSVSGQTFVSPFMKLEDAGRRPLLDLASEIVRRTPEVRAKEQRDLSRLRKFGWLIPTSFLRRQLLHWLTGQLWFRRTVAGTLQVTCLPRVDEFTSYVLLTAASLGVAGVRERVLAHNGVPVVRPTVRLCCALHHKAWDGERASRFLGEVRTILEKNQLEQETQEHATRPGCLQTAAHESASFAAP